MTHFSFWFQSTCFYIGFIALILSFLYGILYLLARLHSWWMERRIFLFVFQAWQAYRFSTRWKKFPLKEQPDSFWKNAEDIHKAAKMKRGGNLTYGENYTWLVIRPPFKGIWLRAAEGLMKTPEYKAWKSKQPA